mmetsp:Transcript_13403/g.19156  ORF Transcript_13403/g.19156 Transcript_13403/m.19156 type:complete len:85 (-) Transcript_13403:287-541(-)|eukprot:CAMPEP_0175091968 /NCGR_PEP_ID=MMETSP0086_2-20121207/2202_1 /TAXON_ID=136419 /ORGANISM="Unknown Unknown, Strain D1" /LENGTH=84 /DNA_ID=CAMNT_0016364779 /DNA_START=27 /DNA_END=281 /DNA_ORIENTATION=-
MEHFARHEQEDLREFQAQAEKAANFQNMVNLLAVECWDKCVTDPSTALSSSESKCTINCANRYLEAMSVASQKIQLMLKQGGKK